MRNYTGTSTEAYLDGEIRTFYHLDSEMCLHRLDGPAIVSSWHEDQFWINDVRYYHEKDYWQHPDVIAYAQQQEAKKLLGLKDD